ncbi:MAG: hydroxyethylthiazole kinase [Methanobacteriaceae archaeon]|jgi:hydroxyethylthiazole kinase|nr:hydroxyethylthiazole kinase [Candidatus Methanorudis spinitermitis]
MFEKSENMSKKIIQAVQNVKSEIPLVNCITNTITINDCANAILAIGGSPTMAEDIDDVCEIIKIANSIVINMGKLNEERIGAIFKACDCAAKLNKPIVLDPVGVGVIKLRNKIAIELIEKYNIATIRGNMSEVKAIANLLKIEEMKNVTSNSAKGVDVSENDIVLEENLSENCNIVKGLAKKTKGVIIASGPIDIISNGKTIYISKNGDPMMAKITGSGCMLTSIVGTFSGVNDPFTAGIAATIVMGIAGENAGKFVKKEQTGTGTFRTKLIDYLYLLNEEKIFNENKLYKINI